MNLTNQQSGMTDLHYALSRQSFSLDVELQIPMRGITGIFGASGAGKTTLLRCIAGLEKPVSGRLAINGDIFEDTARKISRPIHERGIGYVFQEPRLFNHLSVRQNLDYGLRRIKTGQSVDFDAIVELLGLSSLLSRRPSDLSGGEAQRVAIGRALLRGPHLVLMDEPLAAIDRHRRDEILPFLDRLHAEQSIPILYVSHNIDEICRLCDHLIVIAGGRVQAAGDLQSVLTTINTPLLAGDDAVSVIAGTVHSYSADYDLTEFSFSGGALWITGRHQAPGEELRLIIRANDISLCRSQPTDTSVLNIIPVTIQNIHTDDGPFALVRLATGECGLAARITRRSCVELGLAVGDRVLAQIKSVAVRY